MISTKWWFTFRLFGFFMIGVTGTVLLIVAAVVVALRERQSVPLPDVPVAALPAEVRVKAVERNVVTLDLSNAEAVKFLSRKPRRTSTEFGILLPETA